MELRLLSPRQNTWTGNRHFTPLRGLRGLSSGMFPDMGSPIQAGSGSSTGTGGSSGTGGSTGSTDACPACPSNCQTTQKRSTYYVHKQQRNATDRPITMNVKTVVCNDVTTNPQMDCEREIAQIKARNGLSGVGCSACSEYSNRM